MRLAQAKAAGFLSTILKVGTAFGAPTQVAAHVAGSRAFALSQSRSLVHDSCRPCGELGPSRRT